MASELFTKFENEQDFLLFLQISTQALTSRNAPNFQTLKNSTISEEDYKVLYKAIQNLYKDSIIKGQLCLPENFPEFLKLPMESYFQLNQHSIENIIAKDIIVKEHKDLVESFDWKLKWVIGTSTLASVKEPVLQVDLKCLKASREASKTINFEANLDQVDELISCLSQQS